MIAYVGAPASGAHFNPIVTFAFMVTGIQVSYKEAPCAVV